MSEGRRSGSKRLPGGLVTSQYSLPPIAPVGELKFDKVSETQYTPVSGGTSPNWNSENPNFMDFPNLNAAANALTPKPRRGRDRDREEGSPLDQPVDTFGDMSNRAWNTGNRPWHGGNAPSSPVSSASAEDHPYASETPRRSLSGDEVRAIPVRGNPFRRAARAIAARGVDRGTFKVEEKVQPSWGDVARGVENEKRNNATKLHAQWAEKRGVKVPSAPYQL